MREKTRTQKPGREDTGTSNFNARGEYGGRGPGRINPADKKQIKLHPVNPKRIAALFAPHKATIAVVVLLISASSLIGLAQPFLVRGIIDEALPHKDLRLLGLLAGAMIAVAAATAVIGVVQTWMTTGMGQKIMHTLRTRLFTHLQKQSLAFFTRTRSGEVQSRLNNDISGMQSVITSTATGIASNVTTAVATAAAMIVLSPQLSLLSLFVIPPAVWFSRRVALLRRDITSTMQAELATMNTYVEEGLSISGVRLAKTLGTTGRDAARYTESSERLIGLELRSQLAGRWRMATMSIIFSAIPALIYFAGGLPGTTLSIGTIVAFTALQSTIFRPIMGLLNLGVQWVSAMALFSRIFEYLDLEPEIKAPARPVALDPETVRGEVRFENVHFAYDGGPDVLRGINLSLPAGSGTAVVGPTGSGKSTLGALLPRLHDATGGRVTIDGVDVRDIAPDVLARIVGVVSQESYLAHASIRENLLLAAPDADDATLWKALASAQIADLVAGLPDGLDTLVGARGHRFSGGEQQRLAIARTILRNPRVLVLDEATSALDNTTEAAVQLALDHLAVGRTTLTIAHRLTTVEDADQLAVLAGGELVEVGTPSNLRSAGGAYAALIAAGEELELAS
ncbi:ATP-binding cassette subfamily B protein [Arthrobacter stackebrandtii]|uniref:ATP-binding cassette subfamily B protein n=1 Tax=Arthrobacter stackebrandtii TaxID=272161 RepID=A0ABS4YUX4_9MICC|nr:ABC transporter ATP-binding protein [Arthrobacter stackebrandtii]MBP2412549.1 ATP-binding cassette subfamily B protein [Arthrobacter stackebrandtii]PYH02297.1 multidrug ABC transporter ATP-binding protein [Arthrobacter stackebrandtii]